MKLSLPISCPPLLDEIFLKLITHIVISNSFVGCNKVGHPLYSPMHSHRASHHLVVPVVIVLNTLIFYDHVIHNDTSIHDVPEHPLIPKSSRSSDNSKLGLQNLKCSLNVFPSRRLCIIESKFFLTGWFL
jgi:hypothetical protein